MAVLTQMPEEAIIDGFKGNVDFYYWRGLPVARKWPTSPGHRRTQAVMAQWQPFAYASREWNNLSEPVREAYRHLATDSGLSARDMQVRAYLTGLYRYPLP